MTRLWTLLTSSLRASPSTLPRHFRNSVLHQGNTQTSCRALVVLKSPYLSPFYTFSTPVSRPYLPLPVVHLRIWVVYNWPKDHTGPGLLVLQPFGLTGPRTRGPQIKISPTPVLRQLSFVFTLSNKSQHQV